MQLFKHLQNNGARVCVNELAEMGTWKNENEDGHSRFRFFPFWFPGNITICPFLLFLPPS